MLLHKHIENQIKKVFEQLFDAHLMIHDSIVLKQYFVLVLLCLEVFMCWDNLNEFLGDARGFPTKIFS